MRREVLHTEEERRVVDEIDKTIVDLETQYKTGLPASIASLGIKPANEM